MSKARRIFEAAVAANRTSDIDSLKDLQKELEGFVFAEDESVGRVVQIARKLSKGNPALAQVATYVRRSEERYSAFTGELMKALEVLDAEIADQEN